MSGGISASTMMAMGVGALGAIALANAPKAPNMQAPAAPEKPPQAATMPDESARRSGGLTSAALPGTMLTGASGIGAGNLNLGKSTLLGQ